MVQANQLAVYGDPIHGFANLALSVCVWLCIASGWSELEKTHTHWFRWWRWSRWRWWCVAGDATIRRTEITKCAQKKYRANTSKREKNDEQQREAKKTHKRVHGNTEKKNWASNLNCSRSREQQWHQHYSSNKNNNNNNSITIKKGMQKNTTDDEMGWAAHKKWLLIFLSKFCLRLCGDFCLLFSACSYPRYIHSLCMCNSPGTHSILYRRFFSALLFSFGSVFLFYFLFDLCSLYLLPAAATDDGSLFNSYLVRYCCCCHFYSMDFFYFTMRFSTLLLFLHLFFVMIFSFFSLLLPLLLLLLLFLLLLIFFGQWKNRTNERARELEWGGRYAMNPLLNDDKNGKEKWKTKTDNIITTVCNFKHCREMIYIENG